MACPGLNHVLACPPNSNEKIVASREATNQQLLKIYDHLLFQLIGLQEEMIGLQGEKDKGPG